jgi:hypothetical protein
MPYRAAKALHHVTELEAELPQLIQNVASNYFSPERGRTIFVKQTFDSKRPVPVFKISTTVH